MSNDKSNAALLKYLEHEVDSADKTLAAFAQRASSDVEGALSWSADGAYVAVFTKRHATALLEQVKHGFELRVIYDNLLDRLVTLARGQHTQRAEMQAIGQIAQSLKDWLK